MGGMAPALVSRLAIVLLVTMTLAPGLRGNEPLPPVPVPLVVTDARGRSIADLAAADLEITENGSTRSISSVRFHGPEPRRIVILLDEYHVSPGAPSDRARSAVGSFIARHVRPGDTVSVVRPPNRYDPGVTDVVSAGAALEQFAGRKGDYTPRGAFEATYLGSAPGLAARQRAQIVRAALESVATSLRDAEGAKALIVVTEGFEQGEPTRARTTTLRAIGRAARMSNVPVYILDPSASRPEASPLNDAWRTISLQTGGMLFEAGSAMDGAFTRIAADLGARYLIQFEPSGKQDGGFHGIEVRVNRKDAIVRAPTGYWAPFAPSRFAVPSRNRADYLRTVHSSGLIQPWLRMEPGPSGGSRVTFAWAPTKAGMSATRINLEAVTFEGRKLYTGSLPPLPSSTPDDAGEVTFDAPPGPFQLSLRIQGEDEALLATDIKHASAPRFDARKPVITSVEFLRPGSPEEFLSMQADRLAMPTDVRQFFRHDRLILRVRAFFGARPADVTVRLLNPARKEVQVPALPAIDGASQFDLPFAPYARGEYFLDVRAAADGVETSQRVTFRLVGR